MKGGGWAASVVMSLIAGSDRKGTR